MVNLYLRLDKHISEKQEKLNIGVLPWTAPLVGAEPDVVDAEAGSLGPLVDHVDAVVVVALGQRNRGKLPVVFVGHELARFVEQL